MPDYGVTPTGFNRKRLDQLLDELNAEVKAVFGDNFNVSPESPDGQINGVISESNANLWEIAEGAYNAFNPAAATGASLSNLVQINGITRFPATSSRAELTITGTATTVIPIGSLVSTSDTGDTFATELEVVIGGGGTITVFASALETGTISALIGTLTVIDTPITGWDSVTNLADADVGSDEETDVELRARRTNSVARDAQNTIDSIFAEVSAVLDVTQVQVLENDTDAIVSGLDPHSFQVIVVGGIDQSIAEAIFLKKPVGISMNGTTIVAVDDSQGISHDIKFERPNEIDIYVTVTVNKGSEYPSDGDDQIKQAIVDYANGNLVLGRGFALGDDVIHFELYTPANSVPGHEIIDLRSGIAITPTGIVNIVIASDEISNFTTANIIVTV